MQLLNRVDSRSHQDRHVDRKGRVVVVTGASAGIGRAIVREFAKEEGSIALLARGIQGLEKAKSEVEALGGKALVVPIDVSDAQAVIRATDFIEQTLGPIDIWINNAMVSVFSPVDQMLPEEYQKVTDVSYLGYVYGTLAVLKRMKQRNRGLIIQIGSALGYRSIPLQSAYCAAKHAIVGFTESLRTELLHEKSQVKISIANLPAVNTPQFSWVKTRLPGHPQPVPPIYQPEVIARSIHHLSYYPRRRMDIAFPTVFAVFAQKFIPGLVDRYLAKKGYSSQQAQQLVDPDRSDNLWNPVDQDFGARGVFNNQALNFSFFTWVNSHRGLFLGILLLHISGVLGLMSFSSRLKVLNRSQR